MAVEMVKQRQYSIQSVEGATKFIQGHISSIPTPSPCNTLLGVGVYKRGGINKIPAPGG